MSGISLGLIPNIKITLDPELDGPVCQALYNGLAHNANVFVEMKEILLASATNQKMFLYSCDLLEGSREFEVALKLISGKVLWVRRCQEKASFFAQEHDSAKAESNPSANLFEETALGKYDTPNQTKPRSYMVRLRPIVGKQYTAKDRGSGVYFSFPSVQETMEFPGAFRSGAELRGANQTALYEFLRTEIALAFTFLQTARLAKPGSEHHSELIEKAKTALASIRHFQERIDDPEQRAVIAESADQLEVALFAL